MQFITHAITVDSDNHGTIANKPIQPLVMGESAKYMIHLGHDDGSDFDPPNVQGVTDWRFVLGGDFNQSTPNCLTTSGAYSGNGWFQFDVSESWTTEMVSYLGGAEYKPIQAEIVGIGTGGDTKNDWVFQFQTYIRNRVDAIGHDAPSAVTPYITSADLEEERATYLEPILTGVESISGTVATLATSAQFDTVMRALNSDYTNLESGHTAIIESGTFGLVQLTNKVAAVQSAIGDIQTALAAITGVA